MNTMKFTTLADAKHQTGLSYLGNVNSSAKMLHSQIMSHQYTYILYLAPAETSGYNVCSHSTKECRLGCLATSGRAGMELISGSDRIKNARIKKTKLFYEQPEFFMQWLIAEIRVAQLKAKKDGYFFSVRLNGTSDIDWQNVRINGQNIFEIFPEVSFYDYTKNVMKFFNLAPNYHLTLSYTGRNWHLCEVMLKNGHNVAMVFNVKNEKQLPLQFADYQVINGDLTDYRVADAKGIIVGLKWKRIADRVVEKQVLNSCFVVQPNDVRCNTNVQVNELELA
jgi:hypothetical protein